MESYFAPTIGQDAACALSHLAEEIYALYDSDSVEGLHQLCEKYRSMVHTLGLEGFLPAYLNHVHAMDAWLEEVDEVPFDERPSPAEYKPAPPMPAPECSAEEMREAIENSDHYVPHALFEAYRAITGEWYTT